MQTQERITGSVRALMAFERDTQHALAGVLGISQTSVAHKLGGKIQWSIRDLTLLAEHYSVTIDVLIAGPRSWLDAAGQKPGESGGVNHRYPALGSGQVNDGYPDLGSPDLADSLVAA